MCKLLLDGPLPLYRYIGLPASYESRNLSKSLCAKYVPLRKRLLAFVPVSFSNLSICSDNSG